MESIVVSSAEAETGDATKRKALKKKTYDKSTTTSATNSASSANMTPATSTLASPSVSKKTTEEPEGDDTHALVPDTTFSRTSALFQQLERDAEAGNGQFDGLVVGNVSPADFRRIENVRDKRHPEYRLFFLDDISCAIITVPSGPHETGHSRMLSFIDRAVYDMGGGLDDSWRSFQATRFQPTSGGASSGEGDGAAGPRRGNSDGTTKWPTLVLEVGVSQPMTSLRTKCTWWFAASNFRMKVVVLVKMTISRAEITIEKWTARPEFVGQTRRPGATTTRAVARRAIQEPACRQQMVISWAGPAPILQTPSDDRAAELFAVTGTPLILGFEELFLRPPVQANGEHDIIISASMLQDVASRMWEDVL